MIELYYCLMATCCLLWIYLNSDTVSLQWHNKQIGVNFILNVFLMGHASILAFMLVTEVIYDVVFVYKHFVVVVANLFMLYTIRKILRRWQLKKCGKDYHKDTCIKQAIARAKPSLLRFLHT
jgi:small-conductance mechanosensitive channel